MTRYAGQEPGALALCLALARAGQPVTLIDPDTDDRARLRDMRPRLLGAQAHLLDVQEAGEALFSGTPPAPLCTDWRRADGRPVLHHCPGAAAGQLIEQIGPDPTGQIAPIAHSLGALHVVWPAGTIPVSARLHAALGRAMEQALLRGSTPEALDGALVAAGFAVGPFLLQDRLGIDSLLAERAAVEAVSGLEPLPLFARAVGEGRLGRKASVGWYRYPGQGGAVEDPLVEDMAEEEAHFAGMRREPCRDADLAAGIIGQIDAQIDAMAAALVASGALDAAQLGALAEMVIGYAPQRPAMRPSTTAASSPLPDK